MRFQTNLRAAALSIVVTTGIPGAIAAAVYALVGFEPAAILLLVMIAGSSSRVDHNTRSLHL